MNGFHRMKVMNVSEPSARGAKSIVQPSNIEGATESELIKCSSNSLDVNTTSYLRINESDVGPSYPFVILATAVLVNC